MKNWGLIQTVGGIVGLIFGCAAAQEIYLLIHPAYMPQWMNHLNWILTHQHLSFSAMVQKNMTEQFQAMYWYLIAGSFLGLTTGIIVVIIRKAWILKRVNA